MHILRLHRGASLDSLGTEYVRRRLSSNPTSLKLNRNGPGAVGRYRTDFRSSYHAVENQTSDKIYIEEAVQKVRIF